METPSVTKTLTVTVTEVRMFTDSASSEAADATYKIFSALAQAMDNWNTTTLVFLTVIMVFLTVMTVIGAVFAFFGYRNYREWRNDIDKGVTEVAAQTTIETMKTMEGKKDLENVGSDPNRSFLTTQKQPTPRRKGHD